MFKESDNYCGFYVLDSSDMIGQNVSGGRELKVIFGLTTQTDIF